MSSFLHQRSLLPNIYTFLPSSEVWSEKEWPKIHFRSIFSAREVGVISSSFCIVNNYHSLKKERNFGHTLLHTLSPIMEKKTEQSHCAECMRLVFPRQTKGPSVAVSAMVQCHYSTELQTGWVPPHSSSTHTAVVADTRVTKPMPGPGRRSWKPSQTAWTWLHSRFLYRTVWFPTEAGRECTVFSFLLQSFCHKRLIIWVFWFLVAETIGSDSSKEQQLNDW